jgi:saccharopine dehydrogenase (NAD+, L-lysine-forming)
MAIVGDNPTTASADGRTTSDVLLLGAAGSSGRLIAAELVARGLSVRLAGRRRGPLEDLARALAADGATIEVRSVEISDVASLVDAIAGIGVVVSTIGPFARLAGPVIDACLAARTPYVDIANEWSAVRDLLDRDEQARGQEVTLVTGAGFGPAATETLVLRLIGQPRTAPARVRVAAAAQVSRHGDGVRRTIEESISQGAITYRNGQAIREPLGSGATVLTFGGTQRRMVPGPVGDLEAARRASGATDVVAYVADPAGPISGTGSCAWAEVVAPDGSRAVAELVAGEGLRATAAIAAETTRRVLAGAPPGAWTAARLFGPALITYATGARVTVDGRPA